MALIRLMTVADLNTVAALDALAFKAEPRTLNHLGACLALNPEGCLVMDLEGGIPVGYVFSRRWGTVGWLGVGGVHPAHQGQGYGKALMRQGIEQLQASGARVVGLATQTPKNVGTWVSLGFMPGPPTLEMLKTVQATEAAATVVPFSQLDRAKALDAISHLSQQIQPGLDYCTEVINAEAYGWGEPLLLGWPDPWALALLATAPRRPSEATILRVSVLALPHVARQRLPEALRTIEHWAYEQHFEQLVLFVGTHTPDALQYALEAGLQSGGLWIPMALHQPPPIPVGVDLSLWAM